jgi:hypothetical protein
MYGKTVFSGIVVIAKFTIIIGYLKMPIILWSPQFDAFAYKQ